MDKMLYFQQSKIAHSILSGLLFYDENWFMNSIVTKRYVWFGLFVCLFFIIDHVGFYTLKNCTVNCRL